MKKASVWKGLAIVLCAMGLLAACGLKGDLYLPEGRVMMIQVA